MVPKLHKRGSSFKGAAAYLLHDKGRATTSERVAWTQSHNLALDDPELCWRIMAATAMDQDRLKQQAGIKATGRKSDQPVLHLTLSWHPEEKATLTPDEMRHAAKGAIRALGAEYHQALMIAHKDEEHPHLHILLNRVNPADGRMLPSSKEKLNLSRWAEEYERDRGKIFCEERVANNEARQRGKYTRGTKDQHRRLFEEIRSGLKVSNDNKDFAAELRKRQKEIDHELSEKGRAQAKAHKEQWQALTAELMARKQAERERSDVLKARMMAQIHAAREREKQTLQKRHDLERVRFMRQESSVAGRMHNAADALKDVFSTHTKSEKAIIGRAFDIVATKRGRAEALEKRHQSELNRVDARYRGIEQEAGLRVREIMRLRIQQARCEFLAKRGKLIEAQEKDRKSLRKEWRQRHIERRRDWHDPARKLEPKEKLKADFARASQNPATTKDAKKARIKQRLLESHRREKGRGKGRETDKPR